MRVSVNVQFSVKRVTDAVILIIAVVSDCRNPVPDIWVNPVGSSPLTEILPLLSIEPSKTK